MSRHPCRKYHSTNPRSGLHCLNSCIMKSFPLEMVVEMVTVAGSKSLVRCGEQTSGRLPPSSFGTIACEITSPQDSRVPEKPIPCFFISLLAVDPITPWTRYAVAHSVRYSYIEHSLQPYKVGTSYILAAPSYELHNDGGKTRVNVMRSPRRSPRWSTPSRALYFIFTHSHPHTKFP